MPPDSFDEFEEGEGRTMSESTADRNPFERLAEEFAERIRRGEHPSLTEYIERFPEHADDIRDLFPALALVEKFKPARQDVDGSLPAASGNLPEQLGDYRILRYLGEGGMGVVYEAVRESLRSHVALKVMHPQYRNRPNYLRRFHTEARSAARLHHTNIVSVFDYGEHDGICYYAMRYIAGQSLDKVLDDIRQLRLEKEGLDAGSTITLTCPMERRATDADVLPEAQVVCATSSLRKTATLGLLTGRFVTEDADESSSEPAPLLSSETAAAAVADMANMGAVTQGLLSDLHQAEFIASPPSQLHPASGNCHESETVPPHNTTNSLMGKSDVRYYREIARLGAQIADALAYAHERGVLHRDIKPPNLILDSLGNIWVTDFGLAKFEEGDDLSRSHDLVGTLRYMAPERFRGVSTRQCDLYALGATLYEMIALRQLFDAQDHLQLIHQIEIESPVPPRQLDRKIPRDLETIVLKTLAKDPSNRYATAQELAAELRRFLEDQPILARRPSRLERVLRWARRHRELVATAAGIFTLALIVSTVAVWTQARKTDAANRSHHAFIIETFPLLDTFTMESMRQASMLFSGRTDPENWEEAIKVCQRALTVYKDASELPPDDLESRAIIARSYSRLGFTRSILSGANAKKTDAASGELSQAEVDSRRSLAHFEQLHAEFPGDAKVRRYFAEAEGMSGWGWFLAFMQRTMEAEPHYRRSVELWRGLVRDPGARNNSAVAARSSENVASELSDLNSLAVMIQTLAKLLEDSSRASEAEDLRQQLDNDIDVLAARFSEPEQRKYWAGEFMRRGSRALFLKEDNRLSASLFFRLVTIFEPANVDAHNHLAWSMMSVPGAHPLPAARALASAQKAVELQPKNWMYWNTLGATAFRSKDWKSADAALRKSISLNEGGGGAIDFFFLAMTLWHQGKTEDAQMYFKKGEGSYLKNNPGDAELRQLYLETSNLMYPTNPPGNPKPDEANGREDPMKSAQKKRQAAPKSGDPVRPQTGSQRSVEHAFVGGT
jgi:serine/threonine protein kinase